MVGHAKGFGATGVHARARRGGASHARAFAGLMLAAACGGAADDGAGDPPSVVVVPERPIFISPRLPRAEPARASEPAPSGRDGLPNEVARLVSSPPQRVDAGQFDALLGYFCVNCHATPPCEQACDGFWFDDWPALAAGGNHGPDDADRMLGRVIDRMSTGGMPPEGALLTRPLPDGAREVMIEFLEEVLSGAR